MRLATWNVNGLRSAAKNGPCEVIDEARPDVLLLQELKCSEDAARRCIEPLMSDYAMSVRASEEPGRSGVGVLTRGEHEVLALGLGHPGLDSEGRLLMVDFQGIRFVSCYGPSGASRKDRLALKHQFLRTLFAWAVRRGEQEPVVLGGDLNVAHTELDLEGDPPRRLGPGFLPDERAMFDELRAAGWTDLVRSAAGEEKGPLTWRSRTRGWRLDHLWGSPALAVECVSVEVSSGRPVSDHRLLVTELGAGELRSASAGK